jgi:hypothetical protein
MVMGAMGAAMTPGAHVIATFVVSNGQTRTCKFSFERTGKPLEHASARFDARAIVVIFPVIPR